MSDSRDRTGSTHRDPEPPVRPLFPKIEDHQIAD
jgi:hypothetical protein